MEKGEDENISRQERLCCLCSREVEDLKHFIFKCEILKDKRCRLLSVLYDKTGEPFQRKPYEKQLHELFFASGFNGSFFTVHIGHGKGIFDMYRKTEKLERQSLKHL